MNKGVRADELQVGNVLTNDATVTKVTVFEGSEERRKVVFIDYIDAAGVKRFTAYQAAQVLHIEE